MSKTECPIKENRHYQGHVPRFRIYREQEPRQVLVAVVDTNNGWEVSRVLPYLKEKEDAEFWKKEQSVKDRQERVAWAEVKNIRLV